MFDSVICDDLDIGTLLVIKKKKIRVFPKWKIPCALTVVPLPGIVSPCVLEWLRSEDDFKALLLSFFDVC